LEKGNLVYHKTILLSGEIREASSDEIQIEFERTATLVSG
jgi:transcription elongation factor GreA-like protein